MFFVLVVDTESTSRSDLVTALHAHGYQTFVADNIDSALKPLKYLAIDAIIMAYELPDVSALELLSNIQNINSSHARKTIVMCPDNNVNSRITSLQHGADDALSKPIDFNELIIRLSKLLKRKNIYNLTTSDTIEFNGIEMDIQSLKVFIDGQQAPLSLTEFRLLYYFARNPNKVFLRSELGRITNGVNNKIDQRSIDVYIMRLRKSLQKYGKDSLIQTVRGVGYRFSA